jgi:bifunctional N-acetylglutamate synthase/kinase
LDQNGTVIQSIDINYDSEHLFKQPWFQHGDRRKLLEVCVPVERANQLLRASHS